MLEKRPTTLAGFRSWVFAIAGAAALHGCSGSADSPNYVQSEAPALTATTVGEQTVLGNSRYLAAPPYAAADAGLGERLALQCRSCHTVGKGGGSMSGPGLYGFFGRRAGSVEDFSYSEALAGAKFVWTPRTLDAWLAEPATFLPGNRMLFAGMRNAHDRQALIAFLLRVLDDQGNGRP